MQSKIELFISLSLGVVARTGLAGSRALGAGLPRLCWGSQPRSALQIVPQSAQALLEQSL